MTQEELRNLERITWEDRTIDRIITGYIPVLCVGLLIICYSYISRYCHAIQVDPPNFYRNHVGRAHFFGEPVPFLFFSVYLFLYPGILFSEDSLTIDRWKIIPHKLPSVVLFAASLYLFLKVPARSLPEENALRLYHTLIISVSLVICISGRILIYILYHRCKISPYFNKTIDRGPYHYLVILASILLPLLASLIIDYHFDRIVFPHLY